jgi:hypothetical protein
MNALSTKEQQLQILHQTCNAKGNQERGHKNAWINENEKELNMKIKINKNSPYYRNHTLNSNLLHYHLRSTT